MKVDGLRGDHSLRGGVVKSSARRRVVSPVSLQASESDGEENPGWGDTSRTTVHCLPRFTVRHMGYSL